MLDYSQELGHDAPQMPTRGVDFQNWAQVKDKTLYMKAIKLFNDKAKKGIAALGDEVSVEQAVEFIRTCSAYLDPEQLGDFLSGEHTFNQQVLSAYVQTLDFKGANYPTALRNFLNGAFKLPGEAQKIDRLMEAFASRYHQQNPDVFAHQDAAYTLAFSMIMLGTDAHSPQIKDKMTLEGFKKNNRGMNQGEDFDPTFLEMVYNDITARPMAFKQKLQDHDTFVNDALLDSHDPMACVEKFIEATQKRGFKPELDPLAMKFVAMKFMLDKQEQQSQEYAPQIQKTKEVTDQPIVEKMLDLATRIDHIIKAQGHMLQIKDKVLLKQLGKDIRNNPSISVLEELPSQYGKLATNHQNILDELNRIKALVPKQQIQQSVDWTPTTPSVQQQNDDSGPVIGTRKRR